MGTKEQLKRSAEHFREQLNRPTPDSPPIIPPAETEQILCRPDRQPVHYRGTVTGVELPLYINFIDYEKAFDSAIRETMWKLLRHYGVPEKKIALIRYIIQDMSCRNAHAGQLSESFEVKTGVRQGTRACFHCSSSSW